MDGDDFFKYNKLKNIYKKSKKSKNILVQDNCVNYDENIKKKFNFKYKIYKNSFLYKKIINFWPEIYGTSSLSGNINILSSFFKDINIKKWNLLAIDALIVLYCLNKDKFFLINDVLTVKSLSNNNLSLKYKIFNKSFWKRRNQQIIYWELISKKKINNVDKIICKFVNFFV